MQSNAAHVAHPALRGAEWAPPVQGVDVPAWTPDMDQMLTLTLRHTAFRFDEAARRMQSYVATVREAGGDLPDSVQPPSYDAVACRMRYAELDLRSCRALSGCPTSPSSQADPAETAPAVAAVPRGERMKESDSDCVEHGVLDVHALRCRLIAES
mmetsp:Transcript_949/g.3073  ORF Transcript_949/g.3073 Transcript_949/m.3073 type:complete len:155 (+) Transcript_949:3-467(+)